MTRKRSALLKWLMSFVAAIAAAAASLVQPTLADSNPGSFAISAGVAFQSLPGAVQTPPTLGFQYGFPTEGTTGQPIIYLDVRTFIDPLVVSLGLGYSTELLTKKGPYAGLGIGYSHASWFSGFGGTKSLQPPCVDFCGSFGPSGSNNGIGGKGFAGFYFTPSLALEGNYEISPSLNGFSTNAVGLSLKYRFK